MSLINLEYALKGHVPPKFRPLNVNKDDNKPQKIIIANSPFQLRLSLFPTNFKSAIIGHLDILLLSHFTLDLGLHLTTYLSKIYSYKIK